MVRKPTKQDVAPEVTTLTGWVTSHNLIAVPKQAHWLRRFLAFSGPGYLVAVGYMDPGNWATDIAGGSKYGFTLLSVVILSNLMAIILQSLAARLGIVTGEDLAQACRNRYRKSVSILLWVICEAAIVACDIAEVIGTALALNLLFGIPLFLGALITVLDALLILLLMNRGFRYLEAFIITLLIIIAGCFSVQILLAAPPLDAIAKAIMPSTEIVSNPGMLYIAMGIVGATVMPHNLYLHSSIVQTRAFPRTKVGKAQAIRWATVDTVIALMLALVVNAAILILAATVFHERGMTNITDIREAYSLLSPLLGVGIASTLFGIALLASGLNSAVTATLAGQIVIEGFLRIRLPVMARRVLTRALALLPVLAVIGFYGEEGSSELLVLSQVVLSMQLPFAVVPLVALTSDRKKMGVLVIGRAMSTCAWVIAVCLVTLNLKLLSEFLFT
jgi:manganese transport protein